MFKWECHKENSEEGQYILPDLCQEAKDESQNSQTERELTNNVCEEPHMQFIKTECPDYSSEDDTYILPDQYETAADAVEASLPEKSKKLYKETYVQFLKWMEEKETKSYSEDTLLEYFKELSTKISSISLWPKYSMLRAMINQEKNIDIKSYIQLRSFLKKLNTGVRCKKAKTFTAEEIKRFLVEAPDEQYLDLKAILIIGVTGTCRRKELHQLRVNHVRDENNQLLISLPDAKSHMRRVFIVHNALREIILKYMNLRPSDIEEDHFFLNYQKGKCTRQLIGINKIGTTPQKIAAWLNLPCPKLYTGHSFRRTPASVLADAAAGIETLQVYNDCLSYDDEICVEETKIDLNICNQIMEELDNEESCDSTYVVADLLPEKSKKLYKETYGQFLKWMREKGTKSYSEDILLEYFKELSTKMSPISLWPKYSMLRAMINQKKNIDIKSYDELRSFLKQLNTGVKCKQAKTFTLEEMKKFLLEAPDEQNLDLKVILIIGVTGACRRKELHDIRISNVKDENNQLIITLPDAKTHIMRSFIITNTLRKIVIKYMNLRPKNVEDDHFFLNYQKGKCTKQLIGINKIGTMPQKIARWLNLPSPNLYTAHSFRRTSSSLLVNSVF